MNLIVQAPDVQTSDLKALAKLSCAAAIERVGEAAFRLRDATWDERIKPYCEGARIDYGFVPETARLADFGLVAMDMDSTLITVECIDEIADFAGYRAEVAAITAAAMGGELDFAESLVRRVGLLAGLAEETLARVYDERVRLTPGAERLLGSFRQAGIRTLLVSGGFTFLTDRLKARLAFDYAQANVLEIRNARLTGRLSSAIFDAEGKARTVREARDALGLAAERVLAIGDGADDLAFMGEAGTSVAYRAKPLVKARATYALDWVGLDGLLNLFP